MRLMGLVAIYQRPNTSQPAPGSKVHPYLLGGLRIERANQVWCADITYIPMAKGFLYLVAVMDWVSRAVLAWRLSNTLGAEFCVEALEEALAHYGRPEIFNTDQGCQFTSIDFTGVIERGGVTISMDGKSLPSRKRGPLHGQHLRRAAVAQSQIRGGRVLWKSGLGMRSDEALSKMEEGPPESACRGRFQTATSCEGKEPWW